MTTDDDAARTRSDDAAPDGRRVTARAVWDELTPVTRRLRREQTPAEEMLWGVLRNRRLAGAKFRRQHPIDRCVVDFYCVERGLCVEVDGGVHRGQRAEDDVRQRFLEERGVRVVRFTNEEIMRELPRVLAEIVRALGPSPGL